MAFRLLVHWPCRDILPMTEDFDSARTAARRYRELDRAGMASIAIFSVANGVTLRVSPTRLATLSRAEQRTSPSARMLQGVRAAVASMLLGILASALPSDFDDFGVLETAGFSRAARMARAGSRRA